MTRLAFIDEGTTSGGGGGPSGGDPVIIGPDYGEATDLTAGVGVDFSALAIGPADVGAGVAVDFAQLDLGPFATNEAGVAVDFASLDLGPFATPSVGVGVSGSLVVTGLQPDEDTWFDEAADTTAHGSDTDLIARTANALGAGQRRIYLAWNLTGYSGTTFTSATIDILTSTSAVLDEDAPYALLTNASKPFEEDTATWSGDEPPSGTSRQTGTYSAPTTEATRTITLDATALSNAPGNWLVLRVDGVTLLGLADITVRSKEHTTAPTMDIEVDL